MPQTKPRGAPPATLLPLLMAALLVTIAGCASSPRTHFYTLGADDLALEEVTRQADGVRIGLWRVKLPDFLDRPEIVLRTSPYTLELADFHHWAERLDSDITRLLAHELARQLKTRHITLSPWLANVRNDYQVKVDFSRFDGSLGGEVVVGGVWRLLDGKTGEELSRQPFRYSKVAPGPGFQDLVATLNALTHQLAGDMARVIAARS